VVSKNDDHYPMSSHASRMMAARVDRKDDEEARNFREHGGIYDAKVRSATHRIVGSSVDFVCHAGTW
jgi:hypothetical protein